jgi:hypothetical protein
VCDGTPVTFTGSGAASYSWSGGIVDGVPFTPAATGTYTVAGTDINGCTDSASVTVVVNSLPAVSVSLPQDTACLNGGIVALGGESPAGGSWSGTGVSGNTFDPMATGAGTATVTYSYTDTNGCTGTTTAGIFVDVCSGVSEDAGTKESSIYPNPNTGVFTIELPGNSTGATTVEIFNGTGQLVQRFTMNTTVLQADISTLGSGIYFVRIITEGNTSTHRLVKQ